MGGGAQFLLRYARRPNVLVVCIDALRADRIGIGGSRWNLTPFIDGLAAAGTAWTNCSASSSWTKTAVASMLTGLHPFVHSVMDPENPLGPAVKPLQSVFGAAGYFTFCYQTNPWLGEPEHGFQRNFDIFRFLSHNADKGNRIHVEGVGQEAYVGGFEVVRRMEGLARGLGRIGKPFFGYVHIMDVHHPHLPPPPYNALFSPPDSGGIPDATLAVWYEGRGVPGGLASDPAKRARVIDLYDSCARMADDVTKGIVSLFGEAGLLDGTILVICADHGEELFEHGRTGHAKTLYEEVLRIPVVLCGAGMPRGAVVDAPTRQIDIAPTLLAAAGVKSAPLAGGGNVITGAGGSGGAANIAYLGKVHIEQKRSLTVYAPHVKLIIDETPPPVRNEVYNLRQDPGEKADISADSESLRKELAERFDAEIAAVRGVAQEKTRVEMSPESIEQLKALGYLN